MGSDGEACVECSRNCLMIHQKHDPSLKVSSFFKVMYGKHFSEVLIVPPRFVKIMSLVAQETYLEDSSGRKWDVVLLKVDETLAFVKGWQEFCMNHGIELGDFAVFHYIKSSHFLVKIYGRNGCERLRFSEAKRNMNKRAKTTRDFDARTSPWVALCDKPQSENSPSPCADSQPGINNTKRKNDLNPSQLNGTKRSKVDPAADIPDDLRFMANRDSSTVWEENRAHLFDLSAFESLTNKVDTRQLHGNTCSQNSAKKCYITERKTIISCSINKALLSRKEHSVPSSSCPGINMPLKSESPQMPNQIPHYSNFSAASGGRSRIIDRETKPFSQESKHKPAAEASFNVHRHVKDLSIVPRAMVDTGDIVEDSKLVAKDKAEGVGITKLEPPELGDSSSTHVITVISLVKPDSETYLELPKQLPIMVQRQGEKIEKKLVFLRDPTARLWPVVYHQKNGLMVLASGWKGFRKANNIESGDKCTFIVENIYEAIFAVQILRH